MWLVASHDRRVSLWKSNPPFDLCQLIDWLTFSAPSFAPDGAAADDKNWQSFPPSLARFLDANMVMYIGYGIDKAIQIYHLDTKQIIRTIPLSQWCFSFDLSTIETNDDGHRLIAIGTKDRLVQLKDYAQGTFQDFVGHSDTLHNIRFINNRATPSLITTSANEIFVWKLVVN